MSAESLFAQWVAPARRRSVLDMIGLALPILAALSAVAWRVSGPSVALAMVVLGVGLALLIARRRAMGHDRAWLIRRLDAARPDLEDSSALLFLPPATPTPLQALQRARIVDRLDRGSPHELAAPWSRGWLIALSCAAVLIVVAVVLWPRPGEGPPPLAPSQEGIAAAPGLPRLIAQNLRILPPAYTALPKRDSARLDAQAPLGSRLEWTLRFDPAAEAPRLLLVDGKPVTLRRDGDSWIAGMTLDRSFLYRVDAAAGRGPTPPLHRIDALPDNPPQVKALSPALTLVKPGQRIWTPAFAATDDYGVAASARLRVTLAIGEGENVTFSEREIPVSGTGAARDRRFAPGLDFARFGFAAGGDMVVQLIVRDNRSPAPQEVRGPSVILRWPSARAPESSGLEGMVNTTLPAYFRSQRQIIIDAEALLKRKGSLSADRYLANSGTIGNDQQILRGRYSQFLGGEEEGEPTLPTSDAQGHSDGDGHDHGPPAKASAGFGAPEDVLAEFGHPHDESPASSLDPETRATLKKAVDEMWGSERELKQGRPDLALPYANRALRFIKEVQQATRVFLSKVGPELPPIDPTRRMTGERDGIASRTLPLASVKSSDGPAASAWRALEGSAAPDLTALGNWVRANEGRLPDPLALTAAIDTLRQSPRCAACRARLQSLLWTAMERPMGQALPRRRPDDMGARYLQMIEGGGS